jgi:tetratricopeptide (TPR) repeat protein
MTEAENTAFEERIRQEADLEEAVNAQRLELAAMEAIRQQELRSRMEMIDNRQASPPKNNLLWALMLMGLLLVVLGVYYVFYREPSLLQVDGEFLRKDTTETVPAQQDSMANSLQDSLLPPEKKDTNATPQKPEPTRIFALSGENIQAIKAHSDLFLSSTTRGTGDKDSLPAKAASLILNDQYRQAITLLTSPVRADNTSRSLLATAYLLKKDYALAIPLLEILAADNGYIENEKMQWFLCLAYLGAGRKEEALSSLNKISADKGHPYSQEAMALNKKYF